MIRALVTGRLHDMPQARTSANGNPFSTAKLRADGKDGATVWTSIEGAHGCATTPVVVEGIAQGPQDNATSANHWRPGLARFLYTKANTP